MAQVRACSFCGEQELRFRFCFPGLGVEFLGFVHSPTGSLDVEDNGMMHHAIHNRSGDNGVSEVIAKVFEVDVRCKQCRTLAVAAVDDLEEEGGVPRVLLFQPVEA